jgi:hypothetical protein
MLIHTEGRVAGESRGSVGPDGIRNQAIHVSCQVSGHVFLRLADLDPYVPNRGVSAE